jgi:effector-binding domain-containing protein
LVQVEAWLTQIEGDGGGSRRGARWHLAGVNACVIHQGLDETITQAYVAAHSWIKTNAYSIAGPLCEVYWQGGVAEVDGSGVTEIRYPVFRPQTNASVSH